jgi:hypothetical protein
MLAISPAPQRARLHIRPVAEPIGFDLPASELPTNPLSPVRLTPRGSREHLSRQFKPARRRNESDASLEVSCPSSVCQPRCAIRGGQPPDDPASAFADLRPAPPRPSHFSVALAVLRLTDAMRLCSMCGLVACVVATGAPCGRGASHVARKGDCLWSSAQAPVGETDRSRSRMTRHIKRCRFFESSERPSERSFDPFVRCLSRVMHRRVPWRGVPLPIGSSLRGLAGRVVLPSARPTTLMGFNTLRRFAPAAG